MTTTRAIATALILGATLIPTGCEDRKDYVHRLATQAPDPSSERVQELLRPVGEDVAVTNELTVRRIAETRCTREEACGNIGAGKTFGDREACSNYVQDHGRADLHSARCPGGIDQEELEECLAAIQEQECGSLIDRAARIVACRSSDMCQAIN